MSLTKPKLLGLAASSTGKHLIIAFAIAVTSTVAFKYSFVEARKKSYAEFHKNYDVKADFERMKKAGMFKSVLASGEIGSGW
ncbi:hypothetical protein SNE40_018208 [Patella caerulea]|uniref:Mitochondrial cytochrome c oxidase subunit VIc/VIIs domain-containing protein n=1 Tax=Patella caerulea TaxID=87958 RepID=A0AAN8PGS2_PATCE